MAELAIGRENMIKFIERLHCRCGKNSIYKEYRNHIALKNFAEATGSKYYPGNETMVKLDEKIEKHGLTDLLPGKANQLAIAGKLGEIIINDLYPKLELESIRVENLCYEKESNLLFRTDDPSTQSRKYYYICKACCSICRNHTNGCTIHCRDNFCNYLNDLDKIDLDGFNRRETRVTAELMKKFNSYLNTKQKELVKGSVSLLRSKGYYRSYFDIMELVYTKFDVGFDEAYNAVAKLF